MNERMADWMSWSALVVTLGGSVVQTILPHQLWVRMVNTCSGMRRSVTWAAVITRFQINCTLLYILVSLVSQFGTRKCTIHTEIILKLWLFCYCVYDPHKCVFDQVTTGSRARERDVCVGGGILFKVFYTLSLKRQKHTVRKGQRLVIWFESKSWSCSHRYLSPFYLYVLYEMLRCVFHVCVHTIIVDYRHTGGFVVVTILLLDCFIRRLQPPILQWGPAARFNITDKNQRWPFAIRAPRLWSDLPKETQLLHLK